MVKITKKEADTYMSAWDTYLSAHKDMYPLFAPNQSLITGFVESYKDCAEVMGSGKDNLRVRFGIKSDALILVVWRSTKQYYAFETPTAIDYSGYNFATSSLPTPPVVSPSDARDWLSAWVALTSLPTSVFEGDGNQPLKGFTASKNQLGEAMNFSGHGDTVSTLFLYKDDKISAGFVSFDNSNTGLLLDYCAPCPNTC